MKTLIACLLLAGCLLAQNQPEPKVVMDHYFVGLLFKGPKWTAEATPEVMEIQKGHMANIRKMAQTGKLIVAGPFTDDMELRGMFIFKAASAEEVKAMVAQDPAVKAGRLRLDLHPWMAPKGIRVDAAK
jgi:uncharacterized protein YciI